MKRSAREIDTIIFDVDGTLIDARKDIVKALNRMRAELGLSLLGEDDIIPFVGTGAKDLVRKTLGRGNEGLLESGYRIFAAYYEAHPADESVIYPHVLETLEYFKTKTKIVLSNRRSEIARAAITHLGMSKYFDNVLGADDEICLKPSSCPIDRELARLRSDKSRALMVGDMTYDIQAGKAAGIKTCWVTYGLGKGDEVRPLKPDYIIDDIAELKKIVR